jgi:NADH-quinone oxidoreductase subunit J
LFTDYLFAVEIGGTLLLIASIGAIALAPRRAQGTL